MEHDLAHRRWLIPARPLQLFDRIGGQATVDRLVDLLYDGFAADKELRPLFGRDLTRDRLHQKRFFAEWLGGPGRYSESAWASLHSRHEDLPITLLRAERWLDHLQGALNDAVANEDDRILIFEHAQAIALSLVNHEQATAPSRHRSALIASCGIGARPLARASRSAQRGQVDELAALVADVPDTLARPAFAAQVLQSACLAGRLEVVEWLVEQGVDVNRPSPLPIKMAGSAFEGVLYVTPLCAARLRNRSELAGLLLQHGARDDVFTAAFLGDLSGVVPALAQVPDPACDALTITPVHHAVAGGQLAALRQLLEHEAEPVATGGRALRAAAQRGNAEMTDLLLAHGADATTVGPGRWVLDAEIAPRLAAAGASAGIGTDGAESGDWVRISCTGNQGRKDDPALVAALLQYGANVNQLYDGATPLHYATKAGFTNTIQVLLDAGARGNHGRMP